jgi:hypothetical protein
VKNFARRAYRISHAPSEVKWVYTFFLIFMLIGFATIGGYEFRQVGFHLQSVAEHYRGSSGEGMAFPRPFQAMLETTHFHAFIMGIIYLTLAHLFIATETSRRLKKTLIAAGFLSTLLDLLLPWAVRYLSSCFAPVLIAAWIGEWVSYMAMIAISLYDLWLRPHHPLHPSLDDPTGQPSRSGA